MLPCTPMGYASGGCDGRPCPFLSVQDQHTPLSVSYTSSLRQKEGRFSTFFWLFDKLKEVLDVPQEEGTGVAFKEGSKEQASCCRLGSWAGIPKEVLEDVLLVSVKLSSVHLGFIFPGA